MSSVMRVVLLCCAGMISICRGTASSDPSFAGHHFIVSQTGRNVTLSTAAVIPSGNTTYRHTIFSDTQLSAQTCGDRFSLCDVTLIPDQSSSRMAALLATEQGAAAALFERADSDLMFMEQHIIPLPNNPPCTLSAFYVDVSDIWHGLCYAVNGGVVEGVNLYTVNIDFSSLSSSTLMTAIRAVSVVDSFVLSRAFYSFCDGFSYIVWFDNALFAMRVDIFLSQWAVTQEPGTDVELCSVSGARQVVLYQDRALWAYCQNVTVKVDICNLFIENVNTTFFCLGNESVFLEVRSEYLQVSTIEDYSIPFPLNMTVPYVGDCVYINSELFFVGTSEDGMVVLTDVLQNSTTILTTDASVYHQVVENRFVLYSTSNSSTLLDLSCPDPTSPILVTDMPYILSTFLANNEFSCLSVQTTEPTTAISLQPQESTTTSDVATKPPTNSTSPTFLSTIPIAPSKTSVTSISQTSDLVYKSTLQPPTETVLPAPTTNEAPGLSSNVIAGIVVPVIVVVVLIGVVSTVCIVVFCWRKRKRKLILVPVPETRLRSEPSPRIELSGSGPQPEDNGENQLTPNPTLQSHDRPTEYSFEVDTKKVSETNTPVVVETPFTFTSPSEDVEYAINTQSLPFHEGHPHSSPVVSPDNDNSILNSDNINSPGLVHGSPHFASRVPHPPSSPSSSAATSANNSSTLNSPQDGNSQNSQTDGSLTSATPQAPLMSRASPAPTTSITTVENVTLSQQLSTNETINDPLSVIPVIALEISNPNYENVSADKTPKDNATEFHQDDHDKEKSIVTDSSQNTSGSSPSTYTTPFELSPTLTQPLPAHNPNAESAMVPSEISLPTDKRVPGSSSIDRPSTCQEPPPHEASNDSFQVSSTPASLSPVPDQFQNMISPVEATPDKPNKGPESSTSTVTGRENLLLKNNLHYSDYETKRDVVQDTYIAMKLQGQEQEPPSNEISHDNPIDPPSEPPNNETSTPTSQIPASVLEGYPKLALAEDESDFVLNNVTPTSGTSATTSPNPQDGNSQVSQSGCSFSPSNNLEHLSDISSEPTINETESPVCHNSCSQSSDD